jgi:hypothetical protein
MQPGDRPDPVRATLVAILQQLNRAESMNEGQADMTTLPLVDLERSLRKFWAVDEEVVKVPQALGLLVRNGLVRAELPAPSVPDRSARPGARYGITAEGKQFLVEATEQTDRIA